MSLIGDWQVISLSHTKVYVFSDSFLCLGQMNENPRSNTAWEDRWTWFKSSPEYNALDKIDGEPMEFEWNIFPGFTTLQLCHKVQELLSRLSATPQKFNGRNIFMSTNNWEDSSRKQLSLVNDEQVISLQRTNVYVFFRFCIVLWKDEREPSIKHSMGTKIGMVQNISGIQKL